MFTKESVRINTRSSAIPETLCDAPCQLKSCQPLHSCTNIAFKRLEVGNDFQGDSRSSELTLFNRLCITWEMNEAGKQLEDFCLEHELALANTMFKKHLRRLLYTWIYPDDEAQNQIDYISIVQRWKKASWIVACIQEQTATQIISCLWRRWNSGWLTDNDSTAFCIWILRTSKKRKQFSLQKRWPTSLRHWRLYRMG